MLTTFTQLQGISPSKCYTTELQSLLQKIQVSGKKINKFLKADIMRTRKGKGKFVRGKKKSGLVRESNPGPLAPEARIIPLDQQAYDSR